jgi:hypothetical protein
VSRKQPIVLTPRGELVFTALGALAALVVIPASFAIMFALAGVR